MSRLVEYQAMASDQDAAYSLGDMLGDLRKGVWSRAGIRVAQGGCLPARAAAGVCEQMGNKIRPPKENDQRAGGFPGVRAGEGAAGAGA